jgi:class 3 adenylate cyclase/pimeloyl-ACP methyl ester carboxylesterase
MAISVSFTTTADDVRIAYADIGSGPVVVFVRGWITHIELSWNEPNFRRFVEALSQQLRVVRFDARGNGLSERDVGQPDLEEFVADTEAVIEAIGEAKVTLWGSSFGGPIAIAYAARHPERVERLILEGTYPTWIDLRTDKQQDSVRSLIRMLRTSPEVASAALSYITDPAPGTPHEDRAQRGLASIDPDYLAYLYALRFDVKRMLDRLTLPTLVMHARDSRVWPAEGARLLAAAIPGARYVELTSAQHNPWEGDSTTAIAAICQFCEVPTVHPQGTTRHDRVSVVLFTDLVGSTSLADQLGDVAADELRQTHDEAVAAAVAAQDGTVIKYTGDGAFAEFATASCALMAAQSITSRVHDHNAVTRGPALRLRIGIAAGEPIERDGDLHGSAVNLAARVCDNAATGETLVTGAVRDLTIGKAFNFEDRGTVALKGFAEPQHLYALTGTAEVSRQRVR